MANLQIEYSIFPRSPNLEPHYQMQFSLIHRTSFFGDRFYPLYKGYSQYWHTHTNTHTHTHTHSAHYRLLFVFLWFKIRLTRLFVVSYNVVLICNLKIEEEIFLFCCINIKTRWTAPVCFDDSVKWLRKVKAMTLKCILKTWLMQKALGIQ